METTTNQRRYKAPSRLEMRFLAKFFIKFQKWADKNGYNHFGNDIVAFLGNRRNDYDDHSLQLLKEVYKNLSE